MNRDEVYPSDEVGRFYGCAEADIFYLCARDHALAVEQTVSTPFKPSGQS